MRGTCTSSDLEGRWQVKVVYCIYGYDARLLFTRSPLALEQLSADSHIETASHTAWCFDSLQPAIMKVATLAMCVAVLACTAFSVQSKAKYLR
jgi:hypothetical protein